MILGLGNDLMDIRRIETAIERHGERFLSRIFTDVERAKSDRRAQRAASYAKRFAAKEACAKALGTGLNRGVYWRDMGVVNLPGGKPTMVLTGGALLGAGFGFSWTFLSRWILAALTDEDRAIGSAGMNAVRQTGAAAGAAVAGAAANLAGFSQALKAQNASAAGLWVLVAAIPLVLLGAWWAWRLTDRQARAAANATA